MKHFKHLATVALVVVSGCIATASAAELVTNGGFETGDFTGWVADAGFNHVVVPSSTPNFTPFGTYYLITGCHPNFCNTSQTIVTVAGAHYQFSFEYGTDGVTAAGPASQFIATFDGVTVFDRVNDTLRTAPGFSHQSFSVTATGVSTVIQFLAENTPGFFALDNVSVTPAAAGVPEPGALSLMLAGLAGLAGFGLSKRPSTWSPISSARRASVPV